MPKYVTAPKSYGPEPDPSPGWRVVPDIGEHEFLREAFEAGNGYALVVATMDRAGYVLPDWIAEAWRELADRCMNGNLTWDEALAPKAPDGHKVTVREYKAEMKAMRPLERYRRHRATNAIRRRIGKPVNDPLEGLSKEWSKESGGAFAIALADVMGVAPRTAMYLYNRLPKSERYPYKSRKRTARKGR